MTQTAAASLLPLEDGRPVCWVVTAGLIGMEVQCIGIAEALGLTPIVKRVVPKAPWSWAAPWGPAPSDPAIVPPWPDLVIAAGRQAIPYARAIRRAAGGKTFLAVMQYPKIPLAWVDFLWAPEHDRVSGPNVVTTLTSPHSVTREKLDRAAETWQDAIAHLPHPRVAVLIGGTNSVYQLTEATAARIAAQLATLCDHYGAGLMVTPSRRTGERQIEILRQSLADKPAIVWDGTGDNPYHGFLGSADAILVTCDSVNMIGEAASTGKPVYVIELEGGSPKFRRFLDAMYAAGAARPFAGQLEAWAPVALNATQEIAVKLAQAYLEWRNHG